MSEATQVRRLSLEDLPAVLALQAAVSGDLPEGFLFSKDDDQLRAHLDGTLGVAFGIAPHDELVAVSLLRVPSDEHPNRSGVPFPLVPPEDWPTRAGFLANTIVHPSVRGRGYQRALLDVRIAHAAAAGMRWICAGVHLDNVVSWANLLARGMVIVGIRFDPGYPIIGLLMTARGEAPASDASDRREVGARDARAHEELLRERYVGVEITRDGTVIYQRLALPLRTRPIEPA
ncbi:MAG: hypothetical protein AB1689_13225 [Thermodesulfobacteriota bacterium]